MPDRREEVFWIVGPRRRARLRLRGSFFVVGRLEPFPIFLDDPTISREHLAVVACEDGVRVRDLGSRNGVLVNGTRLDRYAEVRIAPGDVLRVGNTELRLLREGEDPTASAAADEGDEHAVDDTGHTRAIRLATPPPPAPSVDPAASDPGPEDDLTEDLQELAEHAGDDPDGVGGEATSELDVPPLPAAPPAADPPAPDEPLLE